MTRSSALLAAALALACSHAPTAKEQQRAEIHYNLGLEALRSNRAQEALSEFDQAIDADPAFPEAWLGRGLVYEFGFGRLDEAERHYRKALALRPGYSEAHNNLGQLLARQGRLQDAIGEFDLALQNMHYAEPFVARCNKGQVLCQLGRKAEGLTELRTCLSLAPRYCKGHRELGRILIEDGKAAEAAAAFERYTQACTDVPDAWYQLGLARVRTGEAERARQAFRTCEALAGADALGQECRRTRELLQ
jgi:type IV pilus assembly protein PilF